MRLIIANPVATCAIAKYETVKLNIKTDRGLFSVKMSFDESTAFQLKLIAHVSVPFNAGRHYHAQALRRYF